MATADVVRRAKALVFDFDGTLVDSNEVKWRAFDVCFEEFTAHRDEIRAYCRGNNHTPRAAKFRHVYERILGRPYTAAVDAALHQRFAALTTAAIVGAPERPGAARFLASAGAPGAMALLSSTPHATLLEILAARGWSRTFGVVRGAPVDKARWLADFRAARGLGAADVVFFGDTPEDATAGVAAGCTFVGVGDAVGAAAGPHVIADFTEFSAAWAPSS